VVFVMARERKKSTKRQARDLSILVNSAPTDWLLQGEAFVRYRVLADLLDRSPHAAQVESARKALPKDSRIRKILTSQNAEGYWGGADDIFRWWPRKDTTFWVLGVLADFGLSRATARIARACEYVFGTQLPSGAFGWAPPSTPADCFTGILVEALAKLGYGDDPRLGRAYAWITDRVRLDGGFWCKKTGLPGGPREAEPSCAFATLCVLGALVQHPAHRDSEASRQAAAFLLRCWENRGKIKYAGHDSQVGHGWSALKYPFTDYKLLKYLDTMSLCKSTLNDARLLEIAALLAEKADPDGRFYAESIHKAWSEFDFGQKKAPSRWISLQAYRILKRLTRPGAP
jgi:hypothetical protein